MSATSPSRSRSAPAIDCVQDMVTQVVDAMREELQSFQCSLLEKQSMELQAQHELVIERLLMHMAGQGPLPVASPTPRLPPPNNASQPPLPFGSCVPGAWTPSESNTKKPVAPDKQVSDAEESPPEPELSSPSRGDSDRSYDCDDAELNEVTQTKTMIQRENLVNNTLSRFVTGKVFESTASAVILLNSMFIGFTTNWAVQHLEEQTNHFLVAIEISFQVFYVVELALRMGVWRYAFFSGKEFAWNIFDLVLVLSGAFDIFALFLQVDSWNVTWLRALKLLKAAKVLRIVRAFRFFHELRLILFAIQGSCTALLWAMVLLLAFMYLGCLIFVQAAIEVLEKPAGHDPILILDAEKYWGSIYKGVCSVWMGISGGNDWIALAEPLQAAGEHYFIFFMFFIAFMNIAVLNILTGIFVEQCVEAAQGDRDNIVFESSRKNDNFSANVLDIFKEMDEDGSGNMSFAEFKRGMENPEMPAYLEAIDIDAKDAAFFFKLLSGSSLHGLVDAQSFLAGCQRLKGSARMMDIQSITCQIQVVLKATEHLAAFCESQFQKLSPSQTVRLSSFKVSKSMRTIDGESEASGQKDSAEGLAANINDGVHRFESQPVSS